MLSIPAAADLIQSNAFPAGSERVLLADALHRVAATDISVPELYPAFTRSLMDGYACDSRTATGLAATATVSCRITETLTAGQVATRRVMPGEAVRIMTGAMLPEGCDCVVPQEVAEVDADSPETIRIPSAACRAGGSILSAGALGRPGDSLITAGTLIEARHIAALAEFGISALSVSRVPTVAVICTGNELVAYQQTPPPGRLRNSSQPMLVALLQTMGARVIRVESASDSADELDVAIRNGLAAHLLVLTGGVSVGLLDLVPAALQRAGVRQLFHGVRLKPGKPLWCGVREAVGLSNSTLVFGLPGNPVSSLACCELFVRPAIRRMLGRPPATALSAELSHDVSLRGDRPVCQPAVASIQGARLTVSIVPWQFSADLRSTAAANSMVLLEPGQSPLVAGSLVRVWLWDGQIS